MLTYQVLRGSAKPCGFEAGNQRKREAERGWVKAQQSADNGGIFVRGRSIFATEPLGVSAIPAA